jgi:hypothetical protein
MPADLLFTDESSGLVDPSEGVPGQGTLFLRGATQNDVVDHDL